jgi:glycosyltransferase involved in cell wall biosynthesis
MENVLTPDEDARPKAAPEPRPEPRPESQPEPQPGEPRAQVPREKPPKKTEPKAVARPDAPVHADPGAAPEVTVIVPITVGDARTRDVVTALGGELDRLGRSWECILVFDGVRGASWDEAQALAARDPERVKPIAFQQPYGESMCLSAGFERARGRIVVTSPQYVQIDPFELATMLKAIDAGADFVTPWRYPRIDPYLNRIQSAFFNWLMRKIIQMQFHDLNCYFRAFKRQVLEEVAVYGDMYRFLPAIAARQGFKVVEVKVRHLKEWGGTGFFGVAVYVRRFLDILGIVFLSKFTLKPLRFFGAVGGIFLLAGGGVCTTLIVQHFVLKDPGPLLNRTVFLLAFLVFVLGVQIIGFGLVGEIIIYTQARNLREYRIERIYENDES